MDKLPVGQLPDLQQSNNDDEIMVITNSEYSQLKKEKISDLITDFTSTNENNALTKGTDGKMFVTDFGNASNITEGKLPVSVLPDIPKDLLPAIETSDLPASGVSADTYAYPSSVTVNAQGMVTAIEEGTPSGANADTDLSNLTDEGEKHFLNKTQITNCILEAPNGVAEWSGVTPTGTLVNNQGVVSGFSADSYGVINKEIPQNITSLEMYATATLNALDEHSEIFGQLNGNKTTPQMGISVGNNFSCDISPDGSSWVTLIIAPSELTPEIGQTYNWLVTWDIESKILTLKVKKAQDETFTLSKTATLDSVNWTGLMAIGMDQISKGKYFRGTIDLSQSYIKINGKMWWQGNDLGFNQLRVKEGLKTLIPNGRNEDRTLKNIENNVSEDLIYTFEENNTGSYWTAVGENATRLNKKSWEYNNDENYIIGTLKDDNYGNLGTKMFVTMIGDAEVKNGNITSFVPYNPVSIATKDDIESIKKEYSTAYITETYLNGGSGYIVYSNGYCEQWGLTNASAGSQITINYIKTFKDTNYFIAVTSRNNQNDKGGYQNTKIGISANSPYDFGLLTTGFRASTIDEPYTKYAWKASGYLASGEY